MNAPGRAGRCGRSGGHDAPPLHGGGARRRTTVRRSTGRAESMRTGGGLALAVARPRGSVCIYRKSALCIGAGRDGSVASHINRTHRRRAAVRRGAGGEIGVPTASECEFRKLLSRVKTRRARCACRQVGRARCRLSVWPNSRCFKGLSCS